MPTLSGSVFVTFDFVGFHRWPEAPDEVVYLRATHRHLFKVRIDVSVEHQNRAIEYHMFKRDMLRYALPPVASEDAWDRRHGERVLGPMSCEMIAQGILQGVIDLYPDRPYYRVEVSEDGENGSVVEARREVPRE